MLQATGDIRKATGDIRKVALWLGHSDIRATEAYLRVEPAEELEAVKAVLPPAMRRGRFGAPDVLIAALLSPATPTSTGRRPTRLTSPQGPAP